MLRTKIVCTLGPSSSDAATISDLVRAGMDVARVNLSHGGRELHREMIRQVRDAADRARKPVAVLADLQGPKIRVGLLDEPVQLDPEETVVFVPEGEAGAGEIPVTYPSIAEDLSAGDRVLLDDGLLELECLRTEGLRAELRVVRGGLLRSKKGINVPGVNIRTAALTEKDLSDVEFVLSERVEYIGLSFVRRAADLADLRERMDGRALIVAKIEKAQALTALDEILEEADAVMVARGDLGVELPFEQVPLAQKRIVQYANFHGRPVITATQMLESMIESQRPTRAEASDVANAILDGSDCVMLSGETAIGRYPVEAVRAIVRIASEIEGSGVLERGPHYLLDPSTHPRSGASAREHAVASATVESARQLRAPAIIVITRSGFSARLVSSYRPPVPIFAICTDDLTYRQLAAVWGVRPVLASEVEVSYESLTQLGRGAVVESEIGRSGEPVIVTAGFPFHTSGSTNTMRVERL